MKKAVSLILLCLLILTGCGTTAQEPVIETEIETIETTEIPLTLLCIVV